MKKIALLSLIITFNSFACSNEMQPSFGAGNYPDMPFNNFAAGNLGIITPRLSTSYLLVAYRYLNKLPLNTTEQTDVLSVWDGYFSAYFTYLEPVCVNNYGYNDESVNSSNLMQFITKTVNDNKAYFNWREYRLSVLELPSKLPTPVLKPNGHYSSYDIVSFYSALALKEDNIEDINAGPGFNYLVLATERLHAIKEALDKQNSSITDSANEPQKTTSAQPALTQKEELALWIRAQQQIFTRTMESSEKARELLAELPDNVPQLIKDDIQYSIAASYLYDGTSDGAKTAAQHFATLANNDTYPWHEWAKYLQYRALNIAVNHMVQSSDVDTICAENTPCRSLSDQSYEGMLDLSKNTTDQQVKEAAANYVNVLLMRTKWRVQKVYETLLQNSLTNIDKTSFTDLITLSNNVMTGSSNEISSWLTDVVNIRTSEDDKKANTTFNDAYSHWQNHPNNLAWLWLAVYTIKYGDISQQSALTKAVLNVSHQDPAFVPLRMALIDHFTDIKDPTLERRSFINDTLAVLSVGGDFSATILLLNARANLATSLTDFIEGAFFYPRDNLLTCLSQTEPDTAQTHYGANYIIDDAAIIINTLPPSMLIQIGTMPNLPDNYRPVIYANLWVRSILFNDTHLEKAVSTDAMKYNPVLTDTITKMIKSNNPDERKTLFLSALLHYPNLSPMINLKLYETWKGDDLDNPMMDVNSIVLRHESFNTSYNNWLWIQCDNCKALPAPAFLTPAQLTEYQAQLKLINNLESGKSYISDSLIVLANRYPHDLRYAELLALFINYTKYTSGGSKKAFITLKKLYPNSQWAKNTKYYY
jgi:hypothetical protein